MGGVARRVAEALSTIGGRLLVAAPRPGFSRSACWLGPAWGRRVAPAPVTAPFVVGSARRAVGEARGGTSMHQPPPCGG